MTVNGRRYAIAGAMVVVAVALGGIFGILVARALAGYDITPVTDATSSTVTVGDRDLAIWVSPETTSTYCGADDEGTGQSSFSTPTASMSITDGGRTWSRVGVVKGDPGSTHTLQCTTETDLTIGYADNPRVLRYVILGVTLGGTAALLVLTAFVLALVTALRKPRPEMS